MVLIKNPKLSESETRLSKNASETRPRALKSGSAYRSGGQGTTLRHKTEDFQPEDHATLKGEGGGIGARHPLAAGPSQTPESSEAPPPPLCVPVAPARADRSSVTVALSQSSWFPSGTRAPPLRCAARQRHMLLIKTEVGQNRRHVPHVFSQTLGRNWIQHDSARLDAR